MKNKLIAILLIMVGYSPVASSQNNKIVIEGSLEPNFSHDSIAFYIHSFKRTIPMDSLCFEVMNGKIKAIIPTKGPINISTSFFNNIALNNRTLIFEPGDSIHVGYQMGKPVYSGRGSEQLYLYNDYIIARKLFNRPSVNVSHTKTLQQYWEWNQYCNNKLNLFLDILGKYAHRMSPRAYNYWKGRVIKDIEYNRMISFNGLYHNRLEQSLTSSQLTTIFDSTLNNTASQWLINLPLQIEQEHYLYTYMFNLVRRKYNFDNTALDEIQNGKKKEIYYNLGKKIFRGEALKHFNIILMTIHGIEKNRGDTVMENLLRKYYHDEVDETMTDYVKKFAASQRLRQNQLLRNAPGFHLVDAKGNVFTNERLKNKIVCLCFWSRECKDLNANLERLDRVREYFKMDTNVVFLTVSTESNRAEWLSDLRKAGLSSMHLTNVYTVKYGKVDPTARDYVLERTLFRINETETALQAKRVYNTYPSPYFSISDKEGKIIFNSLYYPDIHDGNVLVKAIDKALAKRYDGPYVLHERDNAIVYNLKDSVVSRKMLIGEEQSQLEAQTDVIGKALKIELKRKHSIEPVEFEKPSKLFVLSDIEGNFDALRNLLKTNGIIDTDFNWTFGDGHLVFAGDMFDRGEQVTECLWMIYSLEEKAKRVGGYVHFILGNHEIMNLSGDLRYVHKKYTENARLLNMPYGRLYNEDSELGRWLRTKNVVEKIGNLLFAHGGISPEVNALNLSISQINSLARPYYSNSGGVVTHLDTVIKVLYNSYTSPFWYRHYYKGDHYSKTNNHLYYHATESQIDSTLKKFDVKRIITGHTVVSSKITSHFNDRVINTDTKHAEGKSEALLIEYKNFYRVNAEGKRILLFTDEDK